MTITTEEAERLARLLDVFPIPAAALRSLAAERDALRAEVERLGTACDNYFRQVSLMQMKHARHLPSLETRIARQRRALAKLYQRRHDRKAERDHLEKTAMQAAQCHGRETLRADGLQAENARLREAIKAAFAEGFSAGWEEGLEDGLVRPEGVYPRCNSKTEQSYWQDSHARAALGEKE
jgi:hypothetical protein